MHVRMDLLFFVLFFLGGKPLVRFGDDHVWNDTCEIYLLLFFFESKAKQVSFQGDENGTGFGMVFFMVEVVSIPTLVPRYHSFVE